MPQRPPFERQQQGADTKLPLLSGDVESLVATGSATGDRLRFLNVILLSIAFAFLFASYNTVSEHSENISIFD